jgi:hypothetical protein
MAPLPGPAIPSHADKLHPLLSYPRPLPASYPNSIVVSVAAIDNGGRLAVFKSGRGSNFGARSIHIAAPVRMQPPLAHARGQ